MSQQRTKAREAAAGGTTGAVWESVTLDLTAYDPGPVGDETSPLDLNGNTVNVTTVNTAAAALCRIAGGVGLQITSTPGETLYGGTTSACYATIPLADLINAATMSAAIADTDEVCVRFAVAMSREDQNYHALRVGIGSADLGTNRNTVDLVYDGVPQIIVQNVSGGGVARKDTVHAAPAYLYLYVHENHAEAWYSATAGDPFSGTQLASWARHPRSPGAAQAWSTATDVVVFSVSQDNAANNVTGTLSEIKVFRRQRA